MVLKLCHQVDGELPEDIKNKMYFNIVLDFTIGLVPIFGDIADAWFHANVRNADVLEEYLRAKGAKALKVQGQRASTFNRFGDEQVSQLSYSGGS